MSSNFEWFVKNFDSNKQLIEDYNALSGYEDIIKKLKKKCSTKEEFSEKLESEMRCMYWSRAEYELILKLAGNCILLTPWCGCREPDNVKIDVTNDNSFAWRAFAEHHVSNQVFKDSAKIDIYDQLSFVWSDFVDYCWNFKHKYQRKQK